LIMAEEKKATGLKLFNQTITNVATQKYLADVLGERKCSFVNNLTALVANNAMLQECEPYTLMFAAMKATALNLPLDNSLGFAYVLPYKDNKKGITVAQFQLGYKGVKQLALRSGSFATIPNATDVREGELISRNRLTGECLFNFIDDAEEREKKPVIGYVSYFKLLNGAESTFYMSKVEMEKHALRYSQTYRSTNPKIKAASKWTTDFNDMACKTVVKLNLSKNAPLSVEMQDALKADQSIMFERDKYEYLDNNQPEVDMAKAQEVADMFQEFQDVTQENNDVNK
jgi:recombinase, phage RecT family